MRPRRRLVIVSVALGLLVLLLALGPALIPSDTLAAFVVQRLETALNRTVTVEDVAAGLWPRPHVRLAGLAVARDPGAALTEVRVGELRCEVAWGPLLSRRVEVVAASLDRPELVLALSDSVSAGDGPRGGGALAASPVDVRIRRLDIDGGRLEVRGADGRPLLILAGLAERLQAEVGRTGDLVLAGRTTVDSLRLQLPRGTVGQGMALAWDKDLAYGAEDDRLAVRTSQLLLGDLPVSVTGAIDGLTGAAPAVDLELRGGPADVGSLVGYVPSGWLPVTDELESSGTVELAATVGGTVAGGLRHDVHLSLADGGIAHPDLPSPVSGLKLAVRLVDGLAAVESFSAATAGSRIEAAGTVDYAETVPRVDLHVAGLVDLADASAWAALAPQATPLPDMAGTADFDLSVRGEVSPAAAPSPAGTVTLNAVSVAAEEGGLPLQDLGGRLVLADSTLTLHDLTLRQGGSDYRIGGKIGGYRALAEPGAAAPARVELEIASRRLDADQYAAAGAAGEPADDGALAYLQRMTGSARVAVDTLTVRGQLLTAVRGRVLCDRGRLTLEETTAALYGGRTGIGGVVDLADPRHGAVDLQFGLTSVRLGELAARTPALNAYGRLTGAVSGLVSGRATLQADLDEGFVPDLSGLTSVGRVDVAQGRISGHPLQAPLSGYLDVPALTDVALDEWLQPFRVEGGRLHIDGMKLAGGGMRLEASGWQALDGSVDMALQLTLPPEATAAVRRNLPGPVASLLTGAGDGPLAVPLRVGGTLDGPRIAVDSEALAGAATSRAADEGRRLGDELKGQATDRLRSLLGGAAAPADSAAADSSRRGLGSLLDRLGGGGGGK